MAITTFSCDRVSVMLLSGNYNPSTDYIDLQTNKTGLINKVSKSGKWHS
jgi:hypothetical protein